MAAYKIDNKTLKIVSVFAVALGEHESSKNNIIIQRMKKRGECFNIMDRIYILKIIDNNVVNTSELRAYLSGSNNFVMLIFKINSDTIAAWCLESKKSDILKSIFNEVKDY